MKNIKWLFIALAAVGVWACSEDDLDSTSIFEKDATVKNEFDEWLQKNYTEPYNRVQIPFRGQGVEYAV